ncbi:methyltransferase domain-containing protein [Baekduia soli]|uniref:Methyltransferase domain-containing protein n=1 Tax=Baekduia soli TaxID=496014 RepID=A0A5B8U9J6_9ACTN|nr:methyltransferase domain-containing protein [Baekduia soli]QEC49695.1 methyltransferase domain-containing protein [Baekduia soli]
MDDDSARPREWDAGTYHQVAVPHQGWSDEILERLTLRGDETVLDLGCGTGNVAERLLERLPNGHVIGVDGSAAMVQQARERLPERTTFVHADLLDLEVEPPADAAVSSATFHWIADHDRLFARVRAALVPGAPLVAQCGGRGNIAGIVAGAEAVAAHEPFAPYLAGWPGPWNFAGPEETTERLQRAGFAVQNCWLADSPQRPERIRDFLGSVTLGSHLLRLPEKLRDPFLDAVVEQLGPDPVQDYVRLNIVASAV